MRRVQVKWNDVEYVDNFKFFSDRVYTAYGYFHQWGCTYDEMGNTLGNRTIAIVELSNGRIVSVSPNRVIFLD